MTTTCFYLITSIWFLAFIRMSRSQTPGAVILHNGQELRFYNATLITWYQAMSFCETQSSSLLKVDNAIKQAAITEQLMLWQNEFESQYGYWTRGRYNVDGYFKWNDADYFTYMNWVNQQVPFSTTSKAVYMYGRRLGNTLLVGTWNVMHKNYMKLFICEKEDRCGRRPCLNGGFCTAFLTHFTCTCINGYTGSTCRDQSSPCLSDPCWNGGTCNFDGIASYTCTCPHGYSGNLCQFSPCPSNPCLNGGICYYFRSVAYCSCYEGYSGSNCETTPCTSIPCLNGGICNVVGSSFTCTCLSGYSGVNCENTPCTNIQCLNGGSCINEGESHTCSCPPGYSGSDCEINPCSKNNCMNGGSCNIDGSSYSCSCRSGFSGEVCQITPCSNNPCMNGGSCSVNGSSYSCSCASGYKGALCNIANTQGSSESQETGIESMTYVAPIVVILCLLALVGAFVAWKRFRRLDGVKKILESSSVTDSVTSPPDVTFTTLQHENEYGNVQKEKQFEKYRIMARKLRETLNNLRKDGDSEFCEQFSMELPSALPLSHMTSHVAAKEENKKKNRFKNVHPYDSTRVVLTPLEDEPESDYINASYIDCYDVPKCYIATQGPKMQTINDFWRMIWQEESGVIVMLANLVENCKKKCEKYWPEENDSCSYGTISVAMVKSATFDDYVIRTFKITKQEANDSPRKVVQLQYLAWPDHGVPTTSSGLIRFSNKAQSAFNESDLRGPIVVHCSAGVGRTGTFVGFDSLRRELKDKSSVNVFETVLNMRRQRKDMVQALIQYIYLHHLIVETHDLADTDCDISQFRSIVKRLETERRSTNQSILDEEFNKLDLLEPMDTAQLVSRQEINKDKIKAAGVFPYDFSLITMLSLADGSTPFYNASFVKGYGVKSRLIAAQGPMLHTIKDFWHTILSNNVDVIVMLTPLKEDGKEMCAQYWPDKVGDSLEYGDVTVTMTEVDDLYDDVTRRRFSVSSAQLGFNTSNVTQIQYNKWFKSKLPGDGVRVRELAEKAQLMSQKYGKLLVHCDDGVGRTGAFLSILNLVERMKTENKIDVLRCVKDLREMRPGMVNSVAQYRFIYDVMMEYITSFDMYANLNE